MLKLLDIMPIQKEDLTKYKLHLAIGSRDDKGEPFYELLKDNFKSWQEWQSRKNFERDYIFSLIYYGRDEWIFGGIYKRKGVKRVKDAFKYDTELLDVRKDLIGRLIVHYDRKFRASYVNLENYFDDLEVSEIWFFGK